MNTIAGPPDSWIESSRNGMITDDAGYCANGHSIDAGECDCDDDERDTQQGCTCPISAEHCTC